MNKIINIRNKKSINEPFLAVIEIGAELIDKQNANINKIVTIFFQKSDEICGLMRYIKEEAIF